MLDIKFIRENPEGVQKAAFTKGVDVDIDKLLQLDKKRVSLIQERDQLRSKRKSSKKPTKGEIEKIKKVKKKLEKVEKDLSKIEEQFTSLMFSIPNPAGKDVKIGKDEKDNEVIKKVGKPTKFSFKPKDYIQIGEDLDLIDTKRASKVSGTRFGYLKNQVALLEFAIVSYTLNILVKKGFTPVVPPVMVKDSIMQGMGYLEHGGEEEIYHLQKDKLYLVGTSEQSVGPMHTDEILSEDELPIRYTAFSTCFRREAGSYGKDTKGVFRVHQFDKIEMFSFTKPEESDREHEYFLSLEEKLVQGLKLPYQVVKMCTGDLGDPAARKYDIECWVPSEGRYRETHSTSTCTDFQARRLNIRYKDKKTGKNEFVHTINGTAFAIGRIIIAILENGQQKDGSVEIPKVLQKYCGFKEIK
jgi:seryl-tRNA synthetase